MRFLAAVGAAQPGGAVGGSAQPGATVEPGPQLAATGGLGAAGLQTLGEETAAGQLRSSFQVGPAQQVVKQGHLLVSQAPGHAPDGGRSAARGLLNQAVVSG